jgi:hypothetical protein
MLAIDRVEVDLAPASQKFADPVVVHQRCSSLTAKRLESSRRSGRAYSVRHAVFA